MIQGSERFWVDIEAYTRDALAAFDDLTCLKLVARRTGPSVACVARNERDILPTFFAHYRKLGIRHFFVIDNESDDGSIDYLRTRDDVSLFVANTGYRRNNAGNLWVDGVLKTFCPNQWVLRPDVDELLVYPGCNRFGITDVIDVLKAHGLTRLLAPLVDVYRGSDGLYFDAQPLAISHDHECGPDLTGGPRARMGRAFGAVAPCLTKYPLLFYGPESSFANVHFPSPWTDNHDCLWGALIHTKLDSDRFARKVGEGVTSRQYYKGSQEYETYARWLTEDLRCEASLLYRGPDDLVAAGIIEPRGWTWRQRLRSRLDPRRWRRMP